MKYVVVLNQDGIPLIPTRRFKHVRVLLASGHAVVVNMMPFTIKLCYPITTTPDAAIVALDPGRTNIGMAVIKQSGKCIYRAVAETNNADIHKSMVNRAAQRRLRRQHFREKKRRRAIKAKTRRAEKFKRLLPGCDEPIECHDIKNKPARFMNRGRPEGWLTPTANQSLQMHIGLVNQTRKVANIKGIAIEVNRFAFASLEDPSITGLDFQNGPLKGYDNVEDAVYSLQGGKCLLCEKKGALHCHHIVPRHLGGSDTIGNRAGLCPECHDLVHKKKSAAKKLKTIKAGFDKKYGGASIANQIIPYLCKAILDMGLELYITNGYETSIARELYELSKDHDIDAYLIACNATRKEPQTDLPDGYELHHYRRHTRAVIYKSNHNRAYKLNGTVVCKNRHKATEQKSDSLEEFIATHTTQEVSQLETDKHPPAYALKKEYKPGSTFYCKGKQYTLNSYEGTTETKKGRRPNICIATTGDKMPFMQCKFTKHNGGWAYA